MPSIRRFGEERIQGLGVLAFLLSSSLIFALSGCTAKRRIASAPSPQRATLAIQQDSPLSTASSPGVGGWIPGVSNDPDKEKQNSQYVTDEALLAIITELQRAASKDPYRFPVPKDVTGANVYKATLMRLQDYEANHPGAYPELLAFTRGRVYEGLYEYDKAIAHYQIASQSTNGLHTEAAKAQEALRRFREIKQHPITASTPVAYLQALDTQIAAWQELREQYAGTPYEALARAEEERLDQAKVAFLEINRHRMEDGNASVVLAYRQLIDKHTESKHLYQYQIQLGDFYFTLAREYVAQNDPQSLYFDSSTFEEIGRAALRLYTQVAHEDGIIEHQEAKGKLEALEAYMATIGRLGR